MEIGNFKILDVLNGTPIKLQNNSYVSIHKNDRAGSSKKEAERILKQNNEEFKILFISPITIGKIENVSVVHTRRNKSDEVKELLLNCPDCFDIVFLYDEFIDKDSDFLENAFLPNIKKPVIMLRDGSDRIFCSSSDNGISISLGKKGYIIKDKKYITIKEKKIKNIRIGTINEFGFGEEYFKNINSKLKLLKVDYNKSRMSTPIHFLNLEIKYETSDSNFLVRTVIEKDSIKTYLFDYKSGKNKVVNETFKNENKDLLDDLGIITSKKSISLFKNIQNEYYNQK